jgi:hypothetical protein
MATVNKTTRKNLVKTEVHNSCIVVFQRADTGEEFSRIKVDSLSSDMQYALMVYGAKQVVSDVVSQVEGIDGKMAGMQKAVAGLEGGIWPKRTSEVSIDKAAETLAASMGISVDALKKMLGQ